MPAWPGCATDRDVLPAGAVTMARRMAARRAAGEPLQYVFGHWSFRHLDLLVDPRVLIPRPETEQVVEVALAEGRRLHEAGDARRRGLVAVDAGTGSGAIALALATELGAGVLREVWAIDASAGALVVASANLVALRRCHADWPPVELVEGNWLEALPEERARRHRPGRRQPALRVRRGVGGAGARGAVRAPAGPRRRDGQ